MVTEPITLVPSDAAKIEPLSWPEPPIKAPVTVKFYPPPISKRPLSACGDCAAPTFPWTVIVPSDRNLHQAVTKAVDEELAPVKSKRSEIAIGAGNLAGVAPVPLMSEPSEMGLIESAAMIAPRGSAFSPGDREPSNFTKTIFPGGDLSGIIA